MRRESSFFRVCLPVEAFRCDLDCLYHCWISYSLLILCWFAMRYQTRVSSFSQLFCNWFWSMDSTVGRFPISVQRGLNLRFEFSCWEYGSLNCVPKCSSCTVMILSLLPSWVWNFRSAIHRKFWKTFRSDFWISTDGKDLMCCGLMLLQHWLLGHYLLLGLTNVLLLFNISWLVIWSWLLCWIDGDIR